jgi:hypothetical protein
MVRAVHLGVTIDTAAAEQVCARHTAGQALRRVRDGRMSRALMTGLAQEGSADREKGRLRRTVRRVAIVAILRDGLMFPKKWATEFRMT